MRQRFVVPWKDAPRWGVPHHDQVCDECGQLVVADPSPAADEVLVCMDCLLRDTPPLEKSMDDRLVPHPFVHAEHCAECLSSAPYRGKYDAKPWNGQM